MEYQHPQIARMLRANGRGIQFYWSMQVKYSTALMKPIHYDDEESRFGCGEEEDDNEDDQDNPVYMHSGKVQIPNGD